MVSMRVNGNKTQFDGDEDTPLLWVLRDHMGLTGTKYGCGIGECGACTVHIDGRAQRSCLVPIAAAQDADITTIEGLAPGGNELHPAQQAWLDIDVPQCGYCQAGQIMAAADLLQRKPNPSDEDIDRDLANLCRCGTYVRIREAVHHAARLASDGGNDE